MVRLWQFFMRVLNVARDEKVPLFQGRESRPSSRVINGPVGFYSFSCAMIGASLSWAFEDHCRPERGFPFIKV